jgi:hypothetical protein
MSEEVTITLAERNAIYAELLSRLSGIDDIRMAVEHDDFESATRLGREFGDELRLMEDLGWGSVDAEGPIALTMPPDQRGRLFARLRTNAWTFRRDQEREEAEIERENRAQRERSERILEACDRILGQHP